MIGERYENRTKSKQGGESLLKINLNKSKFRFFTTLLVSSFILLGPSVSFSHHLGVLFPDPFVTPEAKPVNIDLKGRSLIEVDRSLDMDHASNMSVRKNTNYLTSRYIEKIGKEKRDRLIEVYRSLILVLLDLNFDLRNYPSYDDLGSKGSDEIESLINKVISEGYLHIQKEKEIEKQRKFYSKYISLINEIYEIEQMDTLGKICEFIKSNKDQVDLKKCKMPSDCYRNYENTSKAVNDCLKKSLPFTCNDIFKYYPVNKLLALDSKPGMILKKSEAKGLYYGYNVSQFCGYSYFDIPRFRTILREDYNLSREYLKLYGTERFIQECARQFMGDKIDKYCREARIKRLTEEKKVLEKWDTNSIPKRYEWEDFESEDKVEHIMY